MVGTGREVATVFPAPRGEDTTSVLPELDVPCSWKKEMSAAFDDATPGGTEPQAARCALGGPCRTPSAAIVPRDCPAGLEAPTVQAERNLAPPRLSK